MRAGLAVEDEVTVGLFENLLADGLGRRRDRRRGRPVEGAGMLS